MSKKPASKPDEEMSFEQALEEVERIVSRIESGEVGLEKSIAEYERGMEMIKRCKEILTRAEQRVEELSRAASGLAGEQSPTDGEEDA